MTQDMATANQASLMNTSENTDAANELQQYLTFIVDKEQYGIDILRVVEIRSWEEPRTIPESPYCIKGVMNLRGLLVPVIDLRERFGLDKINYTKFTVVIVVQLGESENSDVLGLVVDSVSEVCSVDTAQHKEVPETALHSGQDYVKGLVMLQDKTVLLLDCKRLIVDIKALQEYAKKM